MYIWFRINPATYVLFRIKPCATFCQVSGYQQIVECRTRPLGFMRIRINPNRRGSECICRNSSQMKRRPCEMTPGQSGSMQIQSGISSFARMFRGGSRQISGPPEYVGKTNQARGAGDSPATAIDRLAHVACWIRSLPLGSVALSPASRALLLLVVRSWGLRPSLYAFACSAG